MQVASLKLREKAASSVNFGAAGILMSPSSSYGPADDGMMVGSVRPWQLLELLFVLREHDWDGTIYFDTFPDLTGLDPVRECELNIETVKRLIAIAQRLSGDNALSAAVAAQDAITSQRIVGRALSGG